MAGEISSYSSQKLVPFSSPDDTESLLAFQFDQDGRPRVVADFQCERDRFALCCFAQAVIKEMMNQTGARAVAQLNSADAASFISDVRGA